MLKLTVEIDSGAVEPLEELVVEVVVLVVVEEEVTVLEAVEVVVVVEEVELGGSSAATSFEKYEGRMFQGLPPPALVM